MIRLISIMRSMVLLFYIPFWNLTVHSNDSVSIKVDTSRILVLSALSVSFLIWLYWWPLDNFDSARDWFGERMEENSSKFIFLFHYYKFAANTFPNKVIHFESFLECFQRAFHIFIQYGKRLSVSREEEKARREFLALQRRSGNARWGSGNYFDSKAFPAGRGCNTLGEGRQGRATTPEALGCCSAGPKQRPPFLLESSQTMQSIWRMILLK